MDRNETYYIKKGKRYERIDRFNMDGFGEGLWLITHHPHSKQTQNMLYAVKTHSIQDVGKFSDFYKAHNTEIREKLSKNYEFFVENLKKDNKSFSIQDLTNVVIKTLSEI